MKYPDDISEINPKGRLILADGTLYEGLVFGKSRSTSGEVVFNTGMVGYPEALTDPSYQGQILVFTYPLIGNYGVPPDQSLKQLNTHLESQKIQVQGLIVSDYSREDNHWNARQSLSQWLNAQQVVGLSGIDTRSLTQKIREEGTMPGKIEAGSRNGDLPDLTPENLAGRVSIPGPVLYEGGERRVVLIDCGCKHNIIRCLQDRNMEVLRVPWNYDFAELQESFDGVLISNGPGNPEDYQETIAQIQGLFLRSKPILGICLGNQLLALAAGASTYKLKYGHRGQNQPVLETGSSRALITSQNHSFAVDHDSLSAEWRPWFINLNDDTNEGIRHISEPFMSVQFHPEAAPGPVDAQFIFDEFAQMVYA